MLRMSVGTKLSIEETLDRARRFFGPGGLGLEAREQSPCCITFEGGGGYVTVTIEGQGAGGKNEVVLETREWEYDVRQFARDIG